MLAHPGRSALGVLGLLALAGCTEPPSYRLDWRLTQFEGQDPKDEELDPPRVTDCTEHGVAGVRVTTVPLRTDGEETTLCDPFVDEREFPCSSSGAVDGPALEPGSYKVFVQGLRRTGEPWFCRADVPQMLTEVDEDGNEIEQQGCLPDDNPCYARAAFEIEVGEEPPPDGTEPKLVGLLTPPECDDGIDNDQDGRVDREDPVCYLDPADPDYAERFAELVEDADFGVVHFVISVGFLDREVVKPSNLDVDQLHVEVDGVLLTEFGRNHLDLSSWPFRLPLLSTTDDKLHPDGEAPDTTHTHILSITARRQETFSSYVDLTEALEHEFMVMEGEANYVDPVFAFTDDRFLAPIEYPARFNQSLLLRPDDNGGPTCELGGFVGNQPIMLERLWIRVTDENSQAVALDTLGLSGTTAVGGMSMSITPIDEGDGWISIECPSSDVSSAPLQWGRYDIEILATIGADTCFEYVGNSALAPQPTSAQSFNLSRLPLDGGMPPPACIECTEDGTKECSGQICVNGICVDKEPGQ